MHEVMHVSKVGAVGDIQSNYSALIESLEKAKFIEIRQGSPVWMAGQSALVFTGDLVDGGAEPGELLCFIPILYRAIQEHKGVLVLIKGNHDEMMLQTFSPFLKKISLSKNLIKISILCNSFAFGCPKMAIKHCLKWPGSKI